MNKKKFFGLLTAVAMLLNAPPLSVLAEEMVEVSGVVGAVTNADGTIAVDKNNFPDEKLLAAIKDQNDGITDTAKVTKLSLTKDEVKDFSGLQYLTGLNNLEISNNTSIEALNLSTNTKLTNLILNNNVTLYSVTLPETQTLTNVTITGNPALTSLDLSPASVLTSATISNNAIAQLDVSNNAFLTSLVADGNKLYSLDTTACPKLAMLNVAGNKIYELKIAEKAIGSLDVAGNKLREFDGSNMKKLSWLNVADNMLESITLPTNETITYLNVDQNHLAALNVEDVLNPNVETTVITGNQSLFVGEDDEAIDLKAYDDNFKGSNATILDKDGKPTNKTVKDGVLPLGTSKGTGGNGGNGGGTDTPPDQPGTDEPGTGDEDKAKPENVDLQAKFAKDPNEEQVTVVFNPTLLDLGAEDIENGKVEVKKVNGTATVEKEPVTLTFKEDKEAEEKNTWVAVPATGEEGEASPTADGDASGTPADGDAEQPGAGAGNGGSTTPTPWTSGTPTNIVVTGTVVVTGDNIEPTPFDFKIGGSGNDPLSNEFKPAKVDVPSTDEPGTDQPGTDEPGTDQPGTDEPTKAIDLATATIVATYTGTGTEDDPYVYTITVDGKEVPASTFDIKEDGEPDADGNLKVTVTALEGSTVYSGSKEVTATPTNPPVKPDPEPAKPSNKDVVLTYETVCVLYTKSDEPNTLGDPVALQIENSNEKIIMLTEDEKKGIEFVEDWEWGANISALPKGYKLPPEGKIEGAAVQEVTLLKSEDIAVVYAEVDDELQPIEVWVYGAYGDSLSSESSEGTKYSPLSSIPPKYYYPSWAPLGEADSFDLREFEFDEDSGLGIVKSLSSSQKLFEVPLEKSDSSETFFLLSEKQLDNVPALIAHLEPVSGNNFRIIYAVGEDEEVNYYIIQIANYPNSPFLGEYAEAHRLNSPYWTTVQTDKTDSEKALFAPLTLNNGALDELIINNPEALPLEYGTAQKDKQLAPSYSFKATPITQKTLKLTAKINKDDLENPNASDFYEISIDVDGDTKDSVNFYDPSIFYSPKQSIFYSPKEGTCSFWFSEAQCMLTLSNLKLDSGDEEKETYSATVTVTFSIYDQMPIDYILPSPTITEMPIKITVNNTAEAETESAQITSVSKEFSQADVDSVLEEVDAAAGYAYEVQGNNNMMVYAYKESIVNRLYNPNSGEHFYTKDVNEKNTLVKFGWQDEGVGWFAPQANVSTTPVYRLYNRNAGDHHYTKDSHEKDTLLAIGWTFEGISWYSATDPKAYDANGTSNRTIEVFREYNPNTKEAGSHNYTISEHENATLISVGWVDEGIAWNALK